MGITAVVLLIISRLWLSLGSVQLLPLQGSMESTMLGVGLGAGITMASSLIYGVWGDYRRSADYYLKLVLRPLVWFDLIWLGLLPGLSEELLFRGVMLPAFGFDIVALLISSCFFGVLHFSGSQNWAYVIWATVIGLVLGYSALATGNLWVPVVAHITTNLISSVIWKFLIEQQRRA